jgi:hypothetical protein
MKKTIFFLIAAMALTLTGCDWFHKGKLSKVDMVVIQNGQMQFYNHASHKLTPYEAEKDSVVNVAFDNNNHLYYTAAHQQDLKLKMLDLSAKDPQPTLCADWQLKLDEITDFMYNTGACPLSMEGTFENLYMINQSYYEEGIEVEAYNIPSGKLSTTTYEAYYHDYPELFNIATGIERDRYYCEGGKFCHITPEGNVCLNDKIDYKALYMGEDLEDVYFYPEMLSPDGQQIVFNANWEIGEGWGYYCVSSMDGKSQKALEDSDNWTLCPKWLSDGTLVYVGKEPRPKDDPLYDEEWNNTRRCIKMVAPDGTASLLVSNAEHFYLNPVGAPVQPKKEKQAFLEGCDMAIFDNGKVTFYNSSTNEFIPFVAENDYVVSGVFHEDYAFFYTVAIGDELYLKEMFLGDYPTDPQLIGSWDLKWSDCVSADSTVFARMTSYLYMPLIMIAYDYLDEFEEFTEARYFNCMTQKKTDRYWPDDVNEQEGDDKTVAQYIDDERLFIQTSIPAQGEEEEDKSVYYYGTDEGNRVCLSDKLEIPKGEYSYEPQFDFFSISPTRESVVFGAYTDWGHVGHGPLCFATLDGKVQLALANTDAVNVYYGWLNDGKLAYAEYRGIFTVATDGTVTQLSPARRFVTAK